MTAYDVMDVTLDTILHTDDWTDATVHSVRKALDADPVLARQVWMWVQMSDRAGCQLESIMPPLDELIELAKDRSGRQMSSACAEHPALNAIVDRLAEDIMAFDSAWSRAANTSPVHTKNRRPAPKPLRSPIARITRSLPRIAAVVGMLAVVLLVVFLVQQDTEQVLTAGEQGVQRITLEDGSKVRLLDGASLRIASGSVREVELDGRAFFDVVPHAAAPFTIRSADVVTTVIGTTFGLEALPTETRVSVVTGEVRVEAGGQDVQLGAGTWTRVPRGGIPDVPTALDLDAIMDWTGLFIFRNTPIDSVAATLGRSFQVRIEVEPPLSDRDLTGTFDREQGLDEILGVVAAAVGAELVVPASGEPYRLVAIRP